MHSFDGIHTELNITIKTMINIDFRVPSNTLAHLFVGLLILPIATLSTTGCSTLGVLPSIKEDSKQRQKTSTTETKDHATLNKEVKHQLYQSEKALLDIFDKNSYKTLLKEQARMEKFAEKKDWSSFDKSYSNFQKSLLEGQARLELVSSTAPTLSGQVHSLAKLDLKKYFPKDYSKLANKVSKATISKPSPDSNGPADWSTILDVTQSLHKKLVKEVYLPKSEVRLTELKRHGAESFAPNAMKESEDAVHQLNQLLITSPSAELLTANNILELSTNAERHLQKTQTLASMVETLHSDDAESLEMRMGEYIQQLNKISQSLNHHDISHLPLEDQLATLAQQAENLSRRKDAQDQLLAEQINELLTSQACMNESQALRDEIAALQKKLEKKKKHAKNSPHQAEYIAESQP